MLQPGKGPGGHAEVWHGLHRRPAQAARADALARGHRLLRVGGGQQALQLLCQ